MRGDPKGLFYPVLIPIDPNGFKPGSYPLFRYANTAYTFHSIKGCNMLKKIAKRIVVASVVGVVSRQIIRKLSD